MNVLQLHPFFACYTRAFGADLTHAKLAFCRKVNHSMSATEAAVVFILTLPTGASVSFNSMSGKLDGFDNLICMCALVFPRLDVFEAITGKSGNSSKLLSRI